MTSGRTRRQLGPLCPGRVGRSREYFGNRRSLFLAALLVAGLSGCAQDFAPDEESAPLEATCPPAGTHVDRLGSESVTYEGSDPEDPSVCLVRFGNGRKERSLAGLFTQPAPDEASLRQGLADLFPLAPGRRTSFIWRSPITGLPDEVGVFQESWHVTGERVARVGRSSRRVWVVEREQRNVSGNESRFAYLYGVQYHIDRETGAPLSFRARSVTRDGTTAPIPGWTATSITVP